MVDKGQASKDRPQAASGPADWLRQLSVVLITLTTLIINGLANSLPLNNLRTGEISNRFDSLFTPAGYVFGIWSLIYVGLIAFTIWQALPAQRSNPRSRAIGWWYVLSGLGNCVWLFFWHYELFALSLLAMLVMLASLIIIYRRLQWQHPTPAAERWCLKVPFSIYLGWISVATVANTATVLLHLQWSGAPFTPVVWTVLMLLVATALGLIFALRERNAAYVAVLIWAFAGIAVKQSATAPVSTTALVAAVLLAVVLAIALFRKPPAVDLAAGG